MNHRDLSAGDDDDRHLPGHWWGHSNSLCFENPRLDFDVSIGPSSQLTIRTTLAGKRAIGDFKADLEVGELFFVMLLPW